MSQGEEKVGYAVLTKDKEGLRAFTGNYMGRDMHNVPLIFASPSEAIRFAKYGDRLVKVTMIVDEAMPEGWEPE